MMEGKMDVNMDVNGGKITAESRPSTLSSLRELLRRVLDIRNVRGISQFCGFGEEKPFNLPSKDQVGPRAQKNFNFFATNYAVSGALMAVITILLNPLFLVVLGLLALFWFYMSSLTQHETPENPFKLLGRPIPPEQRRMGMLIITAGVLLVFGGSILVSICGATAAIATAHAVLRDCPAVRNEEEMGFLSDPAPKPVDVV